jgi:hypothetical protein
MSSSNSSSAETKPDSDHYLEMVAVLKRHNDINDRLRSENERLACANRQLRQAMTKMKTIVTRLENPEAQVEITDANFLSVLERLLTENSNSCVAMSKQWLRSLLEHYKKIRDENEMSTRHNLSLITQAFNLRLMNEMLQASYNTVCGNIHAMMANNV